MNMFANHTTLRFFLVLSILGSGYPVAVSAQEQPRRVYKEKAEIRFLAVSPDGTYVAYSVWQDRKRVHKLNCVLLGKRTKARLVGYGVGARFAPDGARMLFYSEAKGDNKYWLSLVAPKGGPITDLGVEGMNPTAVGPSWAPDGARILFVNPSGAYLIPPELAEATRLSTKTLSNASWHPNGESIAFERKGGGISLIQVATGETRDLTPTSHGVAAVWSPDGKQLAYVHEHEIYLLDPGTRKRKKVSEGTRVLWTNSGLGLLVFDETGSFTEGEASPIPDLTVKYLALDGSKEMELFGKVHDALVLPDGRTVFAAVHRDGIYRRQLPRLPGEPAGGDVTPTDGKRGDGGKVPTLPITRPKRKLDPDVIKAIQ